jgi:hypothetical protein
MTAPTDAEIKAIRDILVAYRDGRLNHVSQWEIAARIALAAADVRNGRMQGKKRGTRHDYHNLPAEWPLPQSFV